MIAEQPATLERLVSAVWEGGAEPVPVAGVERLQAGTIPYRFVIYSWDGESEKLEKLGARLRSGAQLVVVAPPIKLALMTRILADDWCNHVIGEDDISCVAVTVSKFVTGDLFGIEKYVPDGTEVHLTRLRDYQGRSRAIDEVLAHAEQVGVRSKVRSQIGQVCEELLMNALYDAPVDEDGNLLFGEVDLKDRLGKLSPRPVSIRYAATETGFAVSVRDRFGRLDKTTILRYLDKCLHSPTQIDRKVYGAGLGLYLIANAATQYIVNIAPGMATEVVCTFDRKGARTGLRVFSIFVYPGQPAVVQTA
ncbi:MAG TPA: hypothetical protein VH877_33145 [Polyangia bacterium]|nr:hypothetical protein [Polyangia bacterium]